MAAPKKHQPRKWEIDDLLDLGKREKEEGQFLKAVPVIILEKWVREGREKDVANYIRTKPVARRLVDSGLHPPFKPKGSSNVIATLSRIQLARNLTRPPLIESLGGGEFRINLPRYEKLLQDYRQEYCERYPNDYKKLFPRAEDEPDWRQPIPPKEPAERGEDKAIPSTSDIQDEIQSALEPARQLFLRLTEKNLNLQDQVKVLQAALREAREAPLGATSPERMILDEELRNDCAELLANEKYYIDAIRRASVVLETRLRDAVKGTEGKYPRYGASLVRYALEKEKGKLVISEEPNEQDGIHQLFSGAFAFVRNPPAHKKVQYTEQEVWYTIGLIDYLLSLLGQAKPRDR
jgi:uncharacterized protein (TIGR02391 family)